MPITIGDAGGTVNMPYTGVGGSRAFTSPCAVNDLIIVTMRFSNVSNNVAPPLSDNVNTGGYSVIGTPWKSGGNWSALYYKACNAVGTPTVTLADVNATMGSGGVGGPMGIIRFTGFTGVPTLDAAAVVAASGLAFGTYVAPTFNSAFNPELMLAFQGGDPSFHTNGIPGPFLAGITTSPASFLDYKVETATPPVAEQNGRTFDAGTVWSAQTAGFYSASGIIQQPTPQIQLDDPVRAGGSSQLFLGTVGGDGTGDALRLGGADLKMWAADLNAMLGQLFIKTQTLGDANLVLTAGMAAHRIYQNVTLTANRTITLPATGELDGMPFEIVRKAVTPGAFTLTILDPLTGRSQVIPINANGFSRWVGFTNYEWICVAHGTYT